MLLVMAVLDAGLDEPVVLTGVFAIAPFLTALRGSRWATLALAIITVSLVFASGSWNDNFGTDDYLIRLGLITAASAFACQAAWVIARSRRVSRQLQLLNDVAGVANDSELLVATVDQICGLAVPELADICLIDAIADGRIERIAARVAPERRAEVEPRLATREPALPAQIGSAEGANLEPFLNARVVDEDLRAMSRSEEDLEFLRSIDVRSFISVALCSRGRRIGALTLIQAWSGRRQSAEDLEFSQALADRIALALDNAGLFSDLESVERRMDTVMDVLDEAVTINDSSGDLIFANRAAVRLAGCDSLEEMKEVTGTERARYLIFDELGEPLDRSEVYAADSDGDPAPRIIRLVRATDGSEFWLRIRSRHVPGADGTTLYTVSAIQDVTELKLAEFAQSVLASMSELLTTSTDQEAMLKRLVTLLVPRLADCCSVHLPGSSRTLSVVAVAHRHPQREVELEAALTDFPLRLDESGIEAICNSREAAIVEDLSDLAITDEWSDARIARIRDLELSSAMLVPLVAGTKFIGLLNFSNSTHRRAFTDLHLRISEQIADRVAIALDNARVASERSEIAETLQQGLRPPSIPEIPGWKVAAVYRPAGAENKVGGDFYDLFRVEGGWMVVIGDVTGHGARAASVTALARYSLRSAGSLTGNPLDALAELNRALLAQSGDALCSVAVIKLDQRQAGRVMVAVAGHPPPLLIHGSTVTEISAAGPLVGAFADAEWGLETLRVAAGEQLFVYTDGVIEARGERDRFGEKRLQDSLTGSANPDDAIGRIEGELESFCVGEMDDDAAFLAVMRTAESHSIGEISRGARTASV